MSMTPLISVIMSVYNEEKYIAEALNSIQNQTERDFELIIINDCSTDSTDEIIAELAKSDSRIRLIENETNLGLTKNLNKALKLATGKYIARMDGDDISRPDRFKTQIKYLEDHSDIMLISCNTTTFGEKALISDIGGTPEELRCRMLLRPQLAHPGFMMRRELISDFGFEYDEHFRSAQDYDFAARVTKAGHKIAVTPEILLEYRAHAGQVSQTPNLKQFGFADEIRNRLLADIGVALDQEELDAYHKWVLEQPADSETYIKACAILKHILAENTVYDSRILKKEMWKQYFTWMLRAGGVRNAFKICKANPVRYSELISTGIYMMKSKKRRAATSAQNIGFKRRLFRKICVVFMKQLPDKLYLKLMYNVKLGKKCDLKNPMSFDEKLNWLKLYDRKPEYTMMADKYRVREYIKDKIGEDYLIPLIGVWDKAEDIPFEQLPEQFVLKCNHDSASVTICRDKSGIESGKPFDIEAAKTKLNASMQVNYFYPSREWPYRDIKPVIIAEQYMVDESGTELKDYKIYCADGEPYLIQVDFGRFVNHERNLYDTQWNYIDKQIEYPKNPAHQIERPKSLDKMLELSRCLSAGIPSVRTDFYDINGKIYFGEITFYQEGGFAKFEPEEYAYELGAKIKLPKKTNG